MKIKRLRTAVLLPMVAYCLVMGLAACSNDDIANNDPATAGKGGVTFRMTEEDFEPAEEVSTRAAAPTTMIQDLGDGLTAEVTIEPDTTKHAKEKAAATRAITSTRPYTIRAYQGNVLKGEIKGKFNGTTFIPAAGDDGVMYLPHGNYDFVAFNDKVTASGTTLTVNRGDIKDAFYTVQRNVTINQDPRQSVAFSMKHAGAFSGITLIYANFLIDAEITNLEFIPYGGYYFSEKKATNPAERFTYKLETAPGSIPETMTYDFTTDSYTYPTMGQISNTNGVQRLNSNVFTGGSLNIGDKIAIQENDNQCREYLLPTTDLANYKITFTSGEIDGVSLVGKSVTVPTHKLVQANKQYTVNIKLILGYRYLFSDGTTGTLAANPSKTPIGVVVNNIKKLAVALNDAPGGNLYWDQYNYSGNRNSSGGPGNLVRQGNLWGSSLYNLDALKAADDYYTTAGYGGPQSAGGKYWTVPSRDEWIFVLGNLAIPSYSRHKIGENRTYGEWELKDYYDGIHPTAPTLNMTRFNNAFTQAGGTAPSGNYWFAEEQADASGKWQQRSALMYGSGIPHLDWQDKTYNAQVRPIIYY